MWEQITKADIQRARAQLSLRRDETLPRETFRPGDRISLAYGTKKLKKLFAEHRIPASQRSSIPLLVDESGEVLYVHGIARARANLGEMVLNVTVKNAESG